MPMTEEQVKDLESKIGDVEIEPEFELAWTQRELDGAKVAEKNTVIAFKYHKALRLDDAMSANINSLEQIRNSIKYFSNRIVELKALINKE